MGFYSWWRVKVEVASMLASTTKICQKKRPNYKMMTDFRSAPSSVDTNIKATHAAGGELRFDFKM